MSTDPATGLDAWAHVIGQPRAVAHLRASVAAPAHAYLLVGPPGSTKDVAARAFAADVIDAALADAGCSDGDRTRRLALAGAHPDVHEFHRVGPAISAEQARSIVAEAALASVEGTRKVLILHEFHLVRPEAAAVLLKSIEEPPPARMFVICADFVPPEMVTIASRCVRIGFGAVPFDQVVAALVDEGHEAPLARVAADAADGDVDRARLLVADPDLVERRNAFADVPRRLDGSGAAAFGATSDLLGLIEKSAAPLLARHDDEAARLAERAAQLGERGGGRKALEDRHKRELRRHRVDELRSGMWAIARTYRDAAVAGERGEELAFEAIGEAVSRIGSAIESLERNPNESLLLQSLLWSLPPLPPVASAPGSRREASGPDSSVGRATHS